MAGDPPETTVLVVLRAVDLPGLVRGALDFTAGLTGDEADAWRRSWTTTRFLFGNPANLTERAPARVISPGGSTAWLGPFLATRLPGPSRLLKPVAGVLPDLPDTVEVPGVGPTGDTCRELHIAVRDLSFAQYLVHLHHALAESVLMGRLAPGEPLRLIHRPDLDARAVDRDVDYARVHQERSDPDRLRLYVSLSSDQRRGMPHQKSENTGEHMDLPHFTEGDLARLALSSRLQKLSESLRLTVAEEDGSSADEGVDLVAKLWSLLATEVPRLQEAIASYAHVRDTTGPGPADLPDAPGLNWQDALARHAANGVDQLPDPAAQAAALDAWYVQHAQVEPLGKVRDPFSRLLDGRAPRAEDCLICGKYAGLPVPAWAGFPVPPGGHLVDDGTWRVGHGPTPYWPAGTLLIESRRHFVDFADLDAEEAASIGPLIRRFTEPIKAATGASRVHVFSCMEGTRHFHVWLVPRTDDKPAGRTFIADPGYCTPAEAENVVERLRKALGHTVADR
ncbi:DUF6182 family protein [Streptomyces sp. NPDC001027]|uniref:DUF6182 family protein n=1 Tax=Streptomyces sp. NPDC001027 TaxID=3154771 RepID=UPI00332902A6